MYFVHVIPLIRGMTKFNNNYRKMHLLKLLIQRGKTPPPSLNGEYPPPPLPRLPIYHEDLLGQDKWLPYKGELDQNTRILFVIYKNMTCPVYWKRKYTVHGTFLEHYGRPYTKKGRLQYKFSWYFGCFFSKILHYGFFIPFILLFFLCKITGFRLN